MTRYPMNLPESPKADKVTAQHSQQALVLHTCKAQVDTKSQALSPVYPGTRKPPAPSGSASTDSPNPVI